MMRTKGGARASGLAIAIAIALGIGGNAGPVSANEAAHKLAEKFAVDEGRAAAEKKAREAAAKAEEVRKRSIAQRKAAEAKAEEARRLAERQRADEAEILAKARAEYEALKAEELAARAAAEAATKAELEAEAEQRRAAEEQRLAEEARQQRLQAEAEAQAQDRQAAADREKSARDAALRQAEEEREAEGRRLAEKLAKAREGRIGQEVLPALPAQPALAAGETRSPEEAGKPASTVSTAAPQEAIRAPADGRGATPGNDPSTARKVTILLVMAPGDRGIRRFNKSADPVVCLEGTCFVSNGPASPAKIMTRLSALGSINTLGSRAGACNQHLACAFRGVELGSEVARLQPIDLKIMRHDRREAKDVRADTSCVITGGSLDCAQPVRGSDYRMWIVPEALASEAGVEALERALAGGLADRRSTSQQIAR